jgi:hypothetical protein
MGPSGTVSAPIIVPLQELVEKSRKLTVPWAGSGDTDQVTIARSCTGWPAGMVKISWWAALWTWVRISML